MFNDLSSRPVWYRQLQSLADAVGGTKYMVSLDAEEMLAAAQESTGLTDFGPDTWQGHYRQLVDALNSQADLNLVGAITARTEILRSLRNRLQMQELIRRHPQILEEQILQPIFIGGFGRTGTSITHELLALNPSLRAPLTWETHQLGDETVGGNTTAQRIEQTNAEQLIYNEIAPEYRTMHENDAEHPSECAMIHWSEFLSNNWGGLYFAPAYDMYSYAQDWRGAYEFEKRYLQVLQWQEQQRSSTTVARRWVLKNPRHESHLPSLFAVFPDAQFLHTHRDMSKVMGSLCSLMATLRWMKSDSVSTDIFAHMGPAMAQSFKQIIAERESGVLPQDQIHNLYFQDLVTSPVETMAKVYQAVGLDFGDKESQEITDYLDNKPMGKHGKHEYDLEQFGYSRGQLNDMFAHYMDYFSVPFET
ncbi:MAG: sulfotransferase [Pseudomonadales bacterium]